MSELFMPEPERPRPANFALFIERLMSPPPGEASDECPLHRWRIEGAKAMAAHYTNKDGERGTGGGGS